MKKLFFIVSVLFISVFIIESCKTTETLANTKLSGDDTVIVKKNDTAFVKLVDNPSTGYLWVLDTTYNHKMLDYSGIDHDKPKNNLVGSPGSITFKFATKKKGVTTVKFYKQRFKNAPIDSAIFLISID